MDLKRKVHLRCHAASVSTLQSLNLFACPWYIISILTGGKNGGLPWVSLLLIHDQIELLLLQGYFFFQWVNSAVDVTPLNTQSEMAHQSYLFLKTDMLFLSQQRQSLAMTNNAAPHHGSNSSHWLKKTPFLFIDQWCENRNHWCKLVQMSIKIPFKIFLKGPHSLKAQKLC